MECGPHHGPRLPQISFCSLAQPDVPCSEFPLPVRSFSDTLTSKLRMFLNLKPTPAHWASHWLRAQTPQSTSRLSPVATARRNREVAFGRDVSHHRLPLRSFYSMLTSAARGCPGSLPMQLSLSLSALHQRMVRPVAFNCCTSLVSWRLSSSPRYFPGSQPALPAHVTAARPVLIRLSLSLSPVFLSRPQPLVQPCQPQPRDQRLKRLPKRQLQASQPPCTSLVKASVLLP